MLKYLKHLVQLILSPGQGWTDVAATRLPYRELAASGLYPLTALTALSVFISRIYHEGLTLGHRRRHHICDVFSGLFHLDVCHVGLS